MSLDWVRFSLRGYGEVMPTGPQFFKLIGVTPADGFDLSQSDAGVELLMVDMEECRGFEEPFEEFVARVDRGLKRIAGWLAARPPAAFDEWRAAGNTADIFIDGWLNDDQFDLTFPPEFLLACGRLGLPIEICTND
jgi:hypothetical protein